MCRFSLRFYLPVAFMIILGCTAITSPLALAQGNGDDDDGGVYINADDVIAAHENDAATESRTRRAYLQRIRAAQSTQGELTYISLPRLLEAAAQYQTAGDELPDDIRYLNGLTDIQYLFIYPAEPNATNPESQTIGDIVIAGRAESITPNPADPNQPLGADTQRPVIRLTDLAEIFALQGPDSQRSSRRGNGFGCSIDLPASAPARIEATLRGETQPRSLADRQRQQQNLLQAIGNQPVRYFGLNADSPISYACLVADYQLKRLTLGLTPSPTPLLSHAFTETGTVYNRWWFTAADKPIVVDSTGLAFRLNQPLRLSTSGDPQQDTPATPSAERYAQTFTDQFPTVAAAIPAIAHLENLADLALVASLIQRDNLHRRADWNTDTLNQLNLTAARVTPVNAAQTLVNYRSGSYAVGGVNIEFNRTLDPANRDTDTTSSLSQTRHQPEPGTWHATRSLASE